MISNLIIVLFVFLPFSLFFYASHAEETDEPLSIGLGDEAALVGSQWERVPALESDQLIGRRRSNVDLKFFTGEADLKKGWLRSRPIVYVPNRALW